MDLKVNVFNFHFILPHPSHYCTLQALWNYYNSVYVHYTACVDYCFHNLKRYGSYY